MFKNQIIIYIKYCIFTMFIFYYKKENISNTEMLQTMMIVVYNINNLFSLGNIQKGEYINLLQIFD